MTSNKEFYTYATSEDKQHAFVLRGIDVTIELQELINELADTHEIAVNQIYRMKTNRRPLYLVVVPENITLKYLQNNVRYLSNIKITWERRRNERRITQCRRCQLWGHSATNCFRAYRCVKCAGPHSTTSCQKQPDTPAKCCNCGGEHTACSTACPIYQRRVENLDAATKPPPPPKQQYVPAPPPKSNAWAARQAAAQHPQAVPQSAMSTVPASTPSPSRLASQTTQPASSSVGASANACAGTSAGGSSVAEMQALFSIVQDINTKINIKQALLALQAFNNMLGDGKMNKLSKIGILEDFVQNVLPNYDF